VATTTKPDSTKPILTAESVPTTVAEAQALVAALARDEVERYRRLFPKKAELFDAQQAQDFRKAAILREEVEYLQDDETGRQKRRSAILHLHSLQAEELEAKATALDIEIAERQKQSKLLFGKLEDLEGSVELRQRYLGDRTKTRELEVTSGDMKQQARRLRYELENNLRCRSWPCSRRHGGRAGRGDHADAREPGSDRGIRPRMGPEAEGHRRPRTTHDHAVVRLTDRPPGVGRNHLPRTHPQARRSRYGPRHQEANRSEGRCSLNASNQVQGHPDRRRTMPGTRFG
jgi:hypothetical protein